MKLMGIDFTNRVSRKMLCPVCGKDDWCIVSQCGNYVLCPRVQKGSIKSYACGHIHYGNKFVQQSLLSGKKPNTYNQKHIAKVYRSLNFTYQALFPLARKLQVDIHALQNLGVGRCDSTWYFPMYNDRLELIGLKKRNIKGDKWCEKHSRFGIYYPRTFQDGSGSIIICEGESDTASMISKGYRAVGRANSKTCRRILSELLKHHDIVIAADNDSKNKHEPYVGLIEAVKLAGYIDSRSVRIVCNEKYKDIRQWIISGNFSYSDFNKHQKVVPDVIKYLKEKLGDSYKLSPPLK